MPRRRIAEEPVSQIAIWARRLALFALAVAFIAVIAVHTDYVEAIPGRAILGVAIGIAMVGMLFAVAAFVVIWREGLKGFGLALLAFLIGIALIADPAY